MSRLKILYVDTEEFWRGGQEQLVTLMTGMKKRGHEVHLAAPHGSPSPRRRSGARSQPTPFASEVSSVHWRP